MIWYVIEIPSMIDRAKIQTKVNKKDKNFD